MRNTVFCNENGQHSWCRGVKDWVRHGVFSNGCEVAKACLAMSSSHRGGGELGLGTQTRRNGVPFASAIESDNSESVGVLEEASQCREASSASLQERGSCDAAAKIGNVTNH
jgi:hypothetical protein